MNTEQILDILLADTYTLTALKHKLQTLKLYLANILFTKNTPLVLAEEDQISINSLGQAFFRQFKPETLTQTLTSLDAQIKKIQPLVIYLPFEPPPAEIIRLGKWLRGSFSSNFVFETKIDPALMAGCALVWKGVYKDFSIKSRVDQNKDRILEVFRRYIKK